METSSIEIFDPNDRPLKRQKTEGYIAQIPSFTAEDYQQDTGNLINPLYATSNQVSQLVLQTPFLQNLFPQTELVQEQEQFSNGMQTFATDSFSEVLQEVFFSIFKLLKKSDLEMAACVSKTWNKKLNKIQVDRFLENKFEPIDLSLTDAQLSRLLKEHGMKIECLNFGERRIDDKQMIEWIGYCPKLRQLFIHSYKISDEGLARIGPLPLLQKLDLRVCLISDAGLAHLGPLAALKELNLSACGKITDNGLAHLGPLPNLQLLNLACCYRITDAGLAHLGPLANLQKLDLSYCKQITDAGLESLGQLPFLQVLHLRECSLITYAGLSRMNLVLF
jgi:hypothetical protein